MNYVDDLLQLLKDGVIDAQECQRRIDAEDEARWPTVLTVDQQMVRMQESAEIDRQRERRLKSGDAYPQAVRT